jgi:hypothetical protein
VNTRVKLNLSVLVTGVLIWMSILSHPLGLSSIVQLVLNLVVMVPIGLNFVFLRRLKAETARDVAAGVLPAAKVAEGRSRARKKLLALWVFMVPFVLSFPFWLPALTGVSAGRTGDVVVAFATLVVTSLIFWVMLRRMGRS